MYEYECSRLKVIVFCLPFHSMFVCFLQDPSGSPLYVVTTTNMDGTYSCSFLPEVPGIHQVNVNYGKKPVPGSPFLVKVVPFGTNLIAMLTSRI